MVGGGVSGLTGSQRMSPQARHLCNRMHLRWTEGRIGGAGQGGFCIDWGVACSAGHEVEGR